MDLFGDIFSTSSANATRPKETNGIHPESHAEVSSEHHCFQLIFISQRQRVLPGSFSERSKNVCGIPGIVRRDGAPVDREVDINS
jgi:hypothetical protein